MKTWYYGINSLYKTGLLIVVEQPWYLFIVDWFGDHSCSVIPHIQFPNILSRKRDTIKGCPCEHKEVHCKNHDEFYTLKEWYGDLEQWWCGSVATPIIQYVFKHPKRKEYSFEVGYDRIKEMFYESNKKYFDEHEQILKEDENNKNIL